jgi:hypothetical protein
MTQHESGAAFAEAFARGRAALENDAHLDLTEHDACGVGLVVALDGKPSRAVVQAGIDALKAVWHRGAVDADGKTGDGAGIHIEIPQDFFAEVVERGGDRLRPGRIAVGMVFLPKTDRVRRNAAGRSSRPRSSTPGIPSMAGARCRSTSPASARRQMRRAPRSSRS